MFLVVDLPSQEAVRLQKKDWPKNSLRRSNNFRWFCIV
jgi:hypothetical protein